MAQGFDLVLRGGRVIDPAEGVDEGPVPAGHSDDQGVAGHADLRVAYAFTDDVLGLREHVMGWR